MGYLRPGRTAILPTPVSREMHDAPYDHPPFLSPFSRPLLTAARERPPIVLAAPPLSKTTDCRHIAAIRNSGYSQTCTHAADVY